MVKNSLQFIIDLKGWQGYLDLARTCIRFGIKWKKEATHSNTIFLFLNTVVCRMHHDDLVLVSYRQTTEHLFPSGCVTSQLFLSTLQLKTVSVLWLIRPKYIWMHPMTGIKNNNYLEIINLLTDGLICLRTSQRAIRIQLSFKVPCSLIELKGFMKILNVLWKS